MGCLLLPALELRREQQLLQKLPALDLAAGQCLVVRGPNGSGKSTLLRLIAGLSEACEPMKTSLPRRLLGHSLALINELSVSENCKLLYGLDHAQQLSNEQLVDLLGHLGLLPQFNQLAIRLSAGQRRRLQLSRLWMQPANPSLWLLDEPLTALDNSFLEALEQQIARLMSLGHGFVITSHQPILQSVDSAAKQLLEFDGPGQLARLS